MPFLLVSSNYMCVCVCFCRNMMIAFVSGVHVKVPPFLQKYDDCFCVSRSACQIASEKEED